MSEIFKFIFLLTISLVFFTGFGDGGSETSKKAITKMLNEKLGTLKKYKKEPIYHINVDTVFDFEVRINDIIMVKKNDEKISYLQHINEAILESGEQTLNIRFTPAYDLKKNPFREHTSFSLELEYDYWGKGDLIKNHVYNYYYDLPELDSDDKKRLYKQKPIEINTIFKAEVPYKLNGWQDSKVFKAEDIKELTPKVLTVYKKIKKPFESHQGESFNNLVSKGSYNLYQALYLPPPTAKKILNDSINSINRKAKKFAAIKDYKLEISGNGKLLALVRTDSPNKGEGVLREYYAQNKIFHRVSIRQVLLHMPKGSDKFEVIMYRGLIKNIPAEEGE